MKQSSKKGAALIYVVLVSVLIIVLGMGLLSISNSSFNIAVDETKQEQAYLSSKSGLNYFLNALSTKSAAELGTLLQDVNDSGGFMSSRQTVNNDVGDLTIELTYEISGDIERLRIDSVSDINSTSATTTAYLEQSPYLGGFDFNDKPFYVYDTYSSNTSDVEYGSYKGTSITNGTVKTEFESDYATYVNEEDQYGLIDAEAVNITEELERVLGSNSAACEVKTASHDPKKNNGDKEFDGPWANDLEDISCTLVPSSIPTVTETVGSGISSDTRYADRLVFDLYYFVHSTATQYYQSLVYVEALPGVLTIAGERFYSADVVYLSLKNPNDLSNLIIEDLDSTGAYKFSTNSKSFPSVNNAAQNLDGFGYTGNGTDVVPRYNDIEGDAFTMEPMGADVIEDESQAGTDYVYSLDATNSSNFVILIDSPDPAYSVIDDTLYITHDLDAWVYAPDYTVVVRSGINVTGGVVANNVIVESGATVDGRQPAEGFLSFLGSSKTDKSWRVTYE